MVQYRIYHVCNCTIYPFLLCFHRHVCIKKSRYLFKNMQVTKIQKISGPDVGYRVAKHVVAPKCTGSSFQFWGVRLEQVKDMIGLIKLLATFFLKILLFHGYYKSQVHSLTICNLFLLLNS